MKKQLLLCAALAPAVSGCATIVKGGSQDLTINSMPAGATYEIRDNQNPTATPISGVTPGKITLKKGAGYFVGGDYTVVMNKPGYAPATVEVDSSISGWYLGGNLLVGGLIGYLAVDPATGAMWKLQPEDLQVGLIPLASAANPLPVQQTLVATAATVPATATDATPAVAAAALQPGNARTSQSVALLKQPRGQGDVAQILPAGTSLQLQARQVNGEGAWWFAQYESARGWVSEQGLTQ